MDKPGALSFRRLLLDSLLFLVFFCSLTSFIEATYSIGLLGVDLPPEIAYALLILSPLVLLFFPRLLESRGGAKILGGLGLVAWAISLPLGTKGRMIAAGLGCALLLLFFPARLRQAGRGKLELGGGLALAVLLSAAARSLRSGNLILSDGAYLVLGIILAALALSLLLLEGKEPPLAAGGVPDDAQNRGSAESGPIGPGRTIGLCLGVFSCLVMIYFCFTSPAALSRWGQASYPLVMGVQLGALLLFLSVPALRGGLKRPILIAWNLAFTLALGTALRSRQPAFTPMAMYPLDAPLPAQAADFGFWAMLILHPVIYADFAFLAGSLRAGKPRARGLAAGYSLGAFCMLLAIFSQIFTTVYDYIPVIGPLFRDKFTLVVYMPGIIPIFSILFARRDGADGSNAPAPSALKPIWLGGVGALALGAVLVAVLSGANPKPASAKAGLRVLTYNVQQGYRKDGEKGLKEQLALIRAMSPDILGLQETDTARIAGGNGDIVRYFADALGMYSYYGPSPESGTFGVALLSRFPIHEPKTFFMASKGEQTATIDAVIEAWGNRFRVLVTHLGNDGDLVQQKAILERIAPEQALSPTVILMGDFNFNPSTEQYRLTTAGIDDAWIVAERKTWDPGASDPSNMIDHIFVSRGIRVIESDFLKAGPSDHPALFAEIGM
jgi:endonuclease/exonuclease/phosphatase family metal-dependent hydrolase